MRHRRRDLIRAYPGHILLAIALTMSGCTFDMFPRDHPPAPVFNQIVIDGDFADWYAQPVTISARRSVLIKEGAIYCHMFDGFRPPSSSPVAFVWALDSDSNYLTGQPETSIADGLGVWVEAGADLIVVHSRHSQRTQVLLWRGRWHLLDDIRSDDLDLAMDISQEGYRVEMMITPELIWGLSESPEVLFRGASRYYAVDESGAVIESALGRRFLGLHYSASSFDTFVPSGSASMDQARPE